MGVGLQRGAHGERLPEKRASSKETAVDFSDDAHHRGDLNGELVVMISRARRRMSSTTRI
eukprot:14221794-Heterocapsa_arctica.AAC.1